MTPIRLRHPKGVTTIQIDLDNDGTKVSDLQQAILSATEIPPSLQDREYRLAYSPPPAQLTPCRARSVKSGYPPQSLTLIPQLPLSSLGLKKNDQLIVTQASGSGITHAPAPPRPAPPTSSGPAARPPIMQPGKQAMGDEYVQTDAGALIHRVNPFYNTYLSSYHSHHPPACRSFQMTILVSSHRLE